MGSIYNSWWVAQLRVNVILFKLTLRLLVLTHACEQTFCIILSNNPPFNNIITKHTLHFIRGWRVVVIVFSPLILNCFTKYNHGKK